MRTNADKTSHETNRRERPAPWMHAIHPRDRDRAWELRFFGAYIPAAGEDE